MRLTLLFLILASLCRALAAAPAELHVALWVSDNREISEASGTSRPNTGLRAFNEALAREICRRINAHCVLENILFSDILPGVEAHRFDLGFGNFLRTPEREKHVAFSDALWRSSSRLLVRAKRAAFWRSRFGAEMGTDQLRNIRAAAVLGTQQYAYLQSIAGEQGLRLRGVRALADALALLGEDQVDVVLAPMLMAYELLRRENNERLTFIGPPLVENGLGGSIHIALAKDREVLRQAVDSAIAELRADGTYSRLAHRYFPFSLD